MIERKCLTCGTWNKAEDYCISCKAPISPKALDLKKQKEIEEEERLKVPSKTEVFLEKMKTSNYFLVRMVYYIFYSVFMVIGAFGAFLAWMAAMANG